MEPRYYAVIPEGEDPWGRLPLALYRATYVERDDWWWERLDLRRGGWDLVTGRPASDPHPLVEMDRSHASALLEDWKGLRMAPPWLDLEDRTAPTDPPPPRARSRSSTWQWRIFWVAMAITVAVVVLKNVG
ncbi:hypothetical protein [Nocardioides plantarum]|uniref:Uncharacterized protein n=1 Tax=Nocardioides plantarum TaxID=29299 RepID=A0ABV5K6E6_9ACTN|nr:hypothetical protein [Nocardioides plantarum]